MPFTQFSLTELMLLFLVWVALTPPTIKEFGHLIPSAAVLTDDRDCRLVVGLLVGHTRQSGDSCENWSGFRGLPSSSSATSGPV